VGVAEHPQAALTPASLPPASLLGARLAGDAGALRFAEAVFTQLTGPAGALAAAPPAARHALALHLSDLLLDSPLAAADDALALRLLSQPPLAAAFFQNLDLLYRHHSPLADPVGALLMRALEIAAAEESGPAGA
jgi:hypothetical protein